MAEQDDGGLGGPLTLGQTLVKAREARGMSLDAVASQTRIPVRHLQHIENEDWEALPAITYAVGFTRNYANVVGLDGDEIARALRDRIGNVRPRAAAPEYFESADPARKPPAGVIVAVLIAIAVLIGAYMLWRSTLGIDDSPVVAEAPATTPQPAAPAPAPVPAAPAAGQPVALVSTGEVWMRVTDGPGGAQLFSGNLDAGQRFDVPPAAQAPLIRTSRPHLLRVTVGGRDLGPLDPVERAITVGLRAEDFAARPAQPAPAPAR